MAAAFALLVTVISMAVIAGRFRIQANQYTRIPVTDEKGKLQHININIDGETEENQPKSIVSAHEKTDSQHVETITPMETRHEVVHDQLGDLKLETEVYLPNDFIVSPDQTNAERGGMSVDEVESGFSDDRELKWRQNDNWEKSFELESGL